MGEKKESLLIKLFRPKKSGCCSMEIVEEDNGNSHKSDDETKNEEQS
jgi:hypothetical protein